jgi:NADH:ubiquinone oxidoreductase subunit K
MIGYLHYNLADGPSYVLVVLALAGAEVAVGFGLIVLGYRRTGSIDLKKFAVLRDGAKEFDERYGVLTLNTNVSKSN